ncbi:MAG: hypothetical protein ACP5IA_06560 [Sediminispirochaetaceae bacterium]
MKKCVISFLFISVSGMLLMGCMTAGSGGSAPVYFMPPDMAAEHSTAETKFWSGDVTMEEGVRQEGLWEIHYELEVPELQLQEVPIFIPYPVRSAAPQSNTILGGLVTVEKTSSGKQMQYWMVHMYTVRWMYPQARVIAHLKNNSDKTVDTSRMRIEVEDVSGVKLMSRGIGSSVGPRNTVEVELFSIDFNELSEELDGSMPVNFRFVDMPMALNPDGTIREISLYEDSLQLTRTPHTYISDMTLTAVHVAKAMFEEDTVAHYRTNVSLGQYHTTEYFEPAPIHFQIDLTGDPLVVNEPILWDEDKVPNGSPYDFGRPERIFVDGMPSTVEPWKEKM